MIRAWTLLLLACLPLAAHEAPVIAHVQVHLATNGQTMRAVVRLPLEAVRDVDFPRTAEGFLDAAALAPRLDGLAKLWAADPLRLYAAGQSLGPPRLAGARLALPADASFVSFEEAWRRRAESLTGDRLIAGQLFFDVALEFDLPSAAGPLAIEPAYAGLATEVTTTVRFGGRTFVVPGDVVRFPLEPTWMEASVSFVKMGFAHILAGADHLLFLLCLLLPIRKAMPLVKVVTAFTLAHSLTLAAAALEMTPSGLWFAPAVELLIAVSILFLALANITGAGATHGPAMAFGFGLVHGFGFSFALRESLQFAGGHLMAALLAFNVGVEAGQLAALAGMVPLLVLLFRRAVTPRLGTVLISAFVAHTAWHWTADRWQVLSQFRWEWTTRDSALALRGLLGGMVAFAALWYWRRYRHTG
ncbi:MAG: HupE/UreJ family protein [Acidobacteria bacterium]|nr:HupE/UreJ family protein [Acidobacteriota bacterium]